MTETELRANTHAIQCATLRRLHATYRGLLERLRDERTFHAPRTTQAATLAVLDEVRDALIERGGR